MKSTVSRIRFACVLCLLLSAITVCAASEVSDVSIIQFAQANNRINLTVSLKDGGGKSVAGFDVKEITALWDGASAEIESASSVKEAGMAFMFMLDTSYNFSSESQSNIVNAISGWCDFLGEDDKVALYAYGDENKLLSDFTSDFSSFKSALGAVKFGKAKTALYDGLLDCASIIGSAARLPSRRFIILLTDGEDSASSAKEQFGVKAQKALAEAGASLFVVGYHDNAPMGDKAGALWSDLSQGAGGRLVMAGKKLNGMSIFEAYTAQRDLIINGYAITLGGGPGIEPGDHYIQVSADGRTSVPYKLNISESPFIIIPRPEKKDEGDILAQTKAWLEANQASAIAICAALVVLIAALIVIKGKKRGKKKGQSSIEPPVSGPTSADTLSVRMIITDPAGGATRRTCNIGKGFIIGRAAQCDLVFSDMSVSSRHAQLDYSKPRLMISDLRSTNGILLNGVRIDGAQNINSGDTLRIGKVSINMSFDR